jgi:hypothetical protein
MAEDKGVWRKVFDKAYGVAAGMALEEFVKGYIPTFLGYAWFIIAIVATTKFLLSLKWFRDLWTTKLKPWKLRYVVASLLAYGVLVCYGLVIEQALLITRQGERADLHFENSQLVMDGAILKASLRFVNLGRESVEPHATILRGIAIEPKGFNEDDLFDPKKMSLNLTGDAEIVSMQPFQDEVEYRWAILPETEGEINNKDRRVYVVTRAIFADTFGTVTTESCRYWTGIDVNYKSSIDVGHEQWCAGHNGPASHYVHGKWWQWWSKLQ